MVCMGCAETNLTSLPRSSNNPDKLNPIENDMISNAFRLTGRVRDPTGRLLSSDDNVAGQDATDESDSHPDSSSSFFGGGSGGGGSLVPSSDTSSSPSAKLCTWSSST
uniref:Uncharacterized protein n=1 Tax=Arundo donax TaxID=35708 RepID=A0A0A9CW75_ARUDO